jgi:hypothetical protein
VAFDDMYGTGSYGIGFRSVRTAMSEWYLSGFQSGWIQTSVTARTVPLLALR